MATGAIQEANILRERHKRAVEEQLDRMLADPLFSNSKRYPKFLRYVVNVTLNGDGQMLKERIVGIEVFGRPADYDTMSDAIVRVTASEIRKRILIYYSTPARHNEMRLTLGPGSYVPHFEVQVPVISNPIVADSVDLIEEPVVGGSARSDEHALAASPDSSRPKMSRNLRYWPALIGATAAAIVIVCATAGYRYMHRNSALDAFWSPVIGSAAPVLFCIADQSGSTIALMDAADPAKSTILVDHPINVTLNDAIPLATFGAFMQAHNHPYRIQGEAETSLANLRSGPVVLVGAYDNIWTLRLINPLRFHFANTIDMTHYWIEDSQAPQRRLWVRDPSHPGAQKDYGLIARFTDQDTGQAVVMAAGLGQGGTAAAWELVLTPRYMDELAKKLPRGWEHLNIEAVIETTVIKENSGPPHVVAVYTW